MCHIVQKVELKHKSILSIANTFSKFVAGLSVCKTQNIKQ